MALTDILLMSGDRGVDEFNLVHSGLLTDIDLRYTAGRPSFNMTRGNTGVPADNDIVGRKIVMEFPAASGGGTIIVTLPNYAF